MVLQSERMQPDMLVEEIRYDAWLLAAVMLVLLWTWHRHTRNKTRQMRGLMFDDCLPHFKNPVVEQDDVHFPVLSGRYRGHRVRLEPDIDQVTFREFTTTLVIQ